MIGKILFLATLALTTARPSDESAETSSRKNLWEPSDLCPPIHNHFLLPHESDCSKFYYCEYGMKYIVPSSCANGTVFSYEEQVCVHAWGANCKLPGTTTAAPTLPPSTTLPTVPPTLPPSTVPPTAPPTQATTQAPSEILPNGCPANSSIHYLLPHEECDKFYQCVFGNTVEKRCAPGTYFSYKIQVCDWPANVDTSNCKLPVTTTIAPTQAPSTTPTTAPPTVPPSTALPTAPPTQATTQAPSEILPNGCPANSSIHHLLPHEECDKFHQCVFGNTVEKRCAPGTYFNYKIQVCDWPANVDTSNCKLPVTTTVAPTQTPSTTPTTAPPTVHPSTALPTAPPTQATTQAPSEILPNGCPANSSIHHLLPHEECDKFYQCVFGKTVEKRCAPGTYFNYKIQVCDWPANVECASGGDNGSGDNGGGDNGGGDNGGGDNGGGDNGSGDNGGGDNGGGDNGGGDNGSGDGGLEILPNGCPADSNTHHLLPHETECNKFYYCVHGEKVERQCAPGTHFNYAIQVCDWPANVNCENGGGENGGGENGGGENGGAENGGGEDGGNSDDICKNECNLLPWAHATDCDKFWRCDGEKTVLGVCSLGLHFNPNTLTCDYVCNAVCLREIDLNRDCFN